MLEAKHVVSIDLRSIRFFSISSLLVTPASCAVAEAGAAAFGSDCDMDEEVQGANEETTDENRWSRMPDRFALRR